jgi:hypothetical protein
MRCVARHPLREAEVRARRREGPRLSVVRYALAARTVRFVPIVLLALALAVPVHAHKFHASLTEVEYDAADRTLEIAVRLFPDDLEAALARRSGRRIAIDAEGADRRMLEYLRDTLVITGPRGEAYELSWVGMEATVGTVWVYLQAGAPAGLAGGRIRNEMFLELFDDQVNTVNVKDGSRRATIVLKAGELEKPIGW